VGDLASWVADLVTASGIFPDALILAASPAFLVVPRLKNLPPILSHSQNWPMKSLVLTMVGEEAVSQLPGFCL